MKINGTVSEEVVQTNPENGKVSTESRNAAGERAIPRKKKVTRAVLNANPRNPLKTGLFAKELVLTDQEKVEFQALRQTLQVQLKPSTSLQEIGVDAIACCCWRCKLATRREMRRVSALLDAPDNQKVESEGATVPRWYAAGRQELLSGMRWLDGIRSDFAENGLVRDEWKQTMDIAFGPEFMLRCDRSPVMLTWLQKLPAQPPSP